MFLNLHTLHAQRGGGHGRDEAREHDAGDGDRENGGRLHCARAECLLWEAGAGK